MVSEKDKLATKRATYPTEVSSLGYCDLCGTLLDDPEYAEAVLAS
jgi:hypothetical protein